MNSSSLLGLTVKNYFEVCNWQLLPPPSNNYLPKQAKVTSPPRPIVLSRLTVKEFFNSCNWQLLSQNEPAKNENESKSSLSPLLVEKTASIPTALPCLTVAEFFSLCNWHSLPLEVRTQQPLPLEPLEPKSPLTCQVQAFFQMIPWEGSPEIGQIPQSSAPLQAISPAQVEMNLNALSKLF